MHLHSHEWHHFCACPQDQTCTERTLTYYGPFPFLICCACILNMSQSSIPTVLIPFQLFLFQWFLFSFACPFLPVHTGFPFLLKFFVLHCRICMWNYLIHNFHNLEYFFKLAFCVCHYFSFYTRKRCQPPIHPVSCRSNRISSCNSFSLIFYNALLQLSEIIFWNNLYTHISYHHFPFSTQESYEISN